MYKADNAQMFNGHKRKEISCILRLSQRDICCVGSHLTRLIRPLKEVIRFTHGLAVGGTLTCKCVHNNDLCYVWSF